MALAKSGTLQRSASAGSTAGAGCRGGPTSPALEATRRAASVAREPSSAVAPTSCGEGCQQDRCLGPGTSLEARFGRHLAHTARAELRLLLVEQVVELAAEADAEGCLEEQQAAGTDAQTIRLTGADEAVDAPPGRAWPGASTKPMAPGEALLRRARRIRAVACARSIRPRIRHGGVARVDEDADREVDQEGRPRTRGWAGSSP